MISIFLKIADNLVQKLYRLLVIGAVLIHVVHLEMHVCENTHVIRLDVFYQLKFRYFFLNY